MKKFLTFSLAALFFCLCAVPAFATEETLAPVYVTISDEIGDLVLSYEAIGLGDFDGDGVLTVNDALIGAHRQKYESGENGYSFLKTENGLSVSKLWGAETGAYGYYINNAPVQSLTSPIQAGTHIQAFVYTDTENFSDTFAYFDQTVMTVTPNDTVTLTLFTVELDMNGKKITKPAENADILIGGEKIGVQTDKNGKASFTVENISDIIISASHDGITLVPPVCAVHVDTSAMLLAITVLAILAIIVIAVLTVIYLKNLQRTRSVEHKI